MHTLEELKDKLASTFDEVTLLELLNINAEEIVDKFEERIEERFDKLIAEAFDDSNDGEEEPEI